MWSVLPLMRAGHEIVELPFLPGPPRYERARFSGGINISANERNSTRVDEALRVYGYANQPGKLFCAPWIARLLRAAAAGQIPGIDLDGNIIPPSERMAEWARRKR